METIYVKNIKEVKKNKIALEKILKVKLSIEGNQISFSGKGLDEYDAERVFDAMGFGFSAKRALMLKNEDFIFKKVHIKDHTKRNLKDIKSRLIGKNGRTRRVFSQISGCEIMIKEGEVGIIGYVEDVEDTEVAVINLIKGSKQSNMYYYLEKKNKLKKENTSFGDFLK